MTDLITLARRRARSSRDALFLHEQAADEVQDRLESVNKSFSDPLLVTAFPDLWKDHLGGIEAIPPEETLRLEPQSHDLILHAMALHWANDPVGQLIQCRRALRADGLFLGVSFGGQTLHELRACLAEAEVEVTGGLSPRVAPMAELRDMGGLLQRAGFAELIFLTGWAPDESQQKPLRPGSAQQRLADALGTDETKLRN